MFAHTRSRSTAFMLLALIAGPMVMALATPASAEQPAFYTAKNAKLALSGYDPVAYFVSAQAVRGEPTLTAPYQGGTFAFANDANRAAFIADPAKYAPQYGGYCAWAVSQGYTASSDPQAWKIVDGKLYLNYNKSVAATWAKDIPANIAKANANWPKILL
jgi:YHS domain-containing protein